MGQKGSKVKGEVSAGYESVRDIFQENFEWVSKTTSPMCNTQLIQNSTKLTEFWSRACQECFCSYPYQPYPFDNIHILSVSAISRINITFTATYWFDELLLSPNNFDQHRKRGQRPAMCLRGWGKGVKKRDRLQIFKSEHLGWWTSLWNQKCLQILKILLRWSIFGAAKTLHILPIPSPLSFLGLGFLFNLNWLVLWSVWLGFWFFFSL